jgi:hypothetical protein
VHQPAVCRMAGQRAVAAHPEVPSSRHLRQAVFPAAAMASSVLRRQEASLLKELLSKAQRSAALVPRAACPRAQAMHPASPAHAWRRSEAVRCAVAAHPEVSSLRHLRREVSWLLPPVAVAVAVSASCARAVFRWREAAVVGSDAGAAQPLAVPVASARLPGVARQEVSAAAAERLRVAAWDAAAEQQRAAVWDAGEEPQQAVGVSGAAAELQPVAASVPSAASRLAVSRPAADPSAVPWAFRRARALPSPVRRRVARSARAMRMSQAASPSERSWQAARCEGLS